MKFLRNLKERRRERGERDREGESERESKILVKSPKPRNKAQTKVDYLHKIISRNYYTKLSVEIIKQSYLAKL